MQIESSTGPLPLMSASGLSGRSPISSTGRGSSGSVAAVELLTHGRVGSESRVRLHRIICGHQMIEELEVETFERPRRLRV